MGLALRLACLWAFLGGPVLKLCDGEVIEGSLSGTCFADNDPSAVPTFLIIGTAKGGTTDLYEQLADPAVNSDPARPDPPVLRATRKEFNYLARESMVPSQLAPGALKRAEYMARLGHPCANVSQADAQVECIRRAASQYVTVDATAVNLFGPLAPVNLRMLSPNSKIIVMLRDPIERAEVLYRHVCLDENEWRGGTLDNLTDVFFDYLRSAPGLADHLSELAACGPDVACMARLWRGLLDFNMHAPKEVKHFSGALYAYCLATWQEYFLQPSRVLIIDSHAYFRNRSAVLEKVVFFLYGRKMTPAEQTYAREQSFWRKGPKALSRAGTNWILSGQCRQRLQAFYDTHVYSRMGAVLANLKSRGVTVVGFDTDPWLTNMRTAAAAAAAASTAAAGDDAAAAAATASALSSGRVN